MKSLRKDEKGGTAIEYGLIISVIALAIVGALSSLSSSVQGTYKKAGDEMTLSNDP